MKWTYVCDFAATRSDNFMLINFSSYSDRMTIEERLKDPRPIRRDESEGWLLISDAAQPLIDVIVEYVSAYGVPANRFDMSPS